MPDRTGRGSFSNVLRRETISIRSSPPMTRRPPRSAPGKMAVNGDPSRNTQAVMAPAIVQARIRILPDRRPAVNIRRHTVTPFLLPHNPTYIFLHSERRRTVRAYPRGV